MKFIAATLFTAAVFAVSSIDAATCSTTVLAQLLGNENLEPCSNDSGYAFSSGKKPTDEQVASMCKSDACHKLLAAAKSMNLSECQVPLGEKINLLADLIDYAAGKCEAPKPTETPSTTTTTPSTTTATPSTTTHAPSPAAC